MVKHQAVNLTIGVQSPSGDGLVYFNHLCIV